MVRALEEVVVIVVVKGYNVGHTSHPLLDREYKTKGE